MQQIFGDFVEIAPNTHEYLKLGFSPASIPLQQRWRNSGLSADFLADYLSTFFPGEDSAALERRNEIKDAVSYIANELLENAMKFSYAPSHHSVGIDLYLEADAINLYVSNSINPQSVASFQAFIQRLLTEEPNELYMERLTANAEGNNEGGSGLGFLTMLNDYGAQLAWKFCSQEQGPNDVVVTTMVRLAV